MGRSPPTITILRTAVLRDPANAALTCALRHVAVELPVVYPASDMADFVSPDEVAPARRCRLRDIPDRGVVMLIDVPFLPPGALPEFLSRFRANTDGHVRIFAVMGSRDMDFGSLEIEAQTFVEYVNGPRRWVEVCGSCKMGDEGTTIDSVF
ncbi:hypothetical protein K504DRAFT_497571 [Pleomassaria siparia CBS 279.74]|uniref:Uncharacterized protein n=1 Tax=Pleomassaria siparia CBS 279.74 TaxID=1314801 RepID=A0A6G1KS37_9PLEO|nr:hypothetical protein K504DRAFT_497571 [Pleomassaria siparia CBS 279.74]